MSTLGNVAFGYIMSTFILGDVINFLSGDIISIFTLGDI